MDLKKVCHAVLRVRQGKNIHQHLDLIAGLPFEDYQTFQRSFDTVYGWKPDQLQLGFLKVLKGSYMYGHADDYGIVCRSRAPYEVMATRWISYGELLEIHLVEQMLEQMYNSGQFRTALSVLEKAYGSPFQMFLDMAHFFPGEGLAGEQSQPDTVDRDVPGIRGSKRRRPGNLVSGSAGL